MYHSDEPSLEDFLNHAGHVESVATMIKTCNPPFVVGVHGDWGSGKTSFLKKLRLYLAGNVLADRETEFVAANDFGKQLWSATYNGDGQGFETIWFEAWRYQFEPNPIVALLQEVRSHFSFTQLRAGSKRVLDKAQKLTFAALASIDEVTKHIGIQPSKIVEAGEKWERQHLVERLPSQHCRDLLNDAIKTLVDPKGKNRRLVIFIDDLDRCQGAVAFRLLEAMKIYFSIPSCVFVLGLDWQNIKKAVAAELITTGLIEREARGDALIQAADYLNKLCQTVHPLPHVTDLRPFVKRVMTAGVFKDEKTETLDEQWIELISQYDLVTRNPRKIKAFVNALAMYLNQLRPLIPGMGPIDKQLALIVTCLRLNEDRAFRILESSPDFWSQLVYFSDYGVGTRAHPVFSGRSLPDSPQYEYTGAPDGDRYVVGFDPAFHDPADEHVFRPAKLIRAWNKGRPPTDDEFRRYVQLRG